MNETPTPIRLLAAGLPPDAALLQAVPWQERYAAWASVYVAARGRLRLPEETTLSGWSEGRSVEEIRGLFEAALAGAEEGLQLEMELAA